MGGGLSRNSSNKIAPGETNLLYKQKIQRELETKKYDYLHQVEFFLLNVYSNFSVTDSMRILLSSDLAQESFENYLISEKQNEYMILYHEINRITNDDSLGPFEISTMYHELVSKHFNPSTETNDQSNESLLPEAMKIRCVQALEVSYKQINYKYIIDDLLNDLRETVISILAQVHFHSYILSRHYALWRSCERGRALATTINEINATKRKVKKDKYSRRIGPLNQSNPVELTPSVDNNMNGSMKSILSSRRRDRSTPKRPVLRDFRVNSMKFNDFSLRALIHLPNEFLYPILSGDNWLAAMLSAAEALPVGFTLASASKDHKGFPMIYVNKYFQAMTEYPRQEIIGKNCRFLQCGETDQVEILDVSRALKIGKPITTILINKTKQGRIFHNLISLKPLFHGTTGSYMYVMGMNIDITANKDDYEKDFSFVKQLMQTLPSVIVADDTQHTRSLFNSTRSSLAGSPKNDVTITNTFQSFNMNSSELYRLDPSDISNSAVSTQNHVHDP